MAQWSPTKPCPSCAKPIKRDATNCWFCGEVFDTLRCAACESFVKKGSTHCWLCGEEIPRPRTATVVPPAAPPPVVPSSSAEPLQPDAAPPPAPLPVAAAVPPPRAVRGDLKECPNCGERVPLAAVQCRECKEDLTDRRVRRQSREYGWSGEQPPLDRHRGGFIMALALFGFFACGVLTCPIAIVLAILDLKAMAAGTMDPSGEAQTRRGLVLAVIVLVLNLAGLALYVALHV